DLVLGNTIANFTGIRIGGINVPESSLFSFNVTSIFSGGYIYERITDVAQDEFVCFDNEFLGIINFFVDYPFQMAHFFLNEGLPAINYYNVGIEYVCHPFISLDVETWSSAKEFVSTFDTFFLSFYGEDTSIDDYQYQVTEKRKYNQIETFLKVSINDVTTNTTNLTFANSYKFAYSTESGAILGSRIKGNLKGLIENTTIDLIFDLDFDMTSFDLDSFEIGDFATENVSGHNTNSK
ncbi:MAG: choice-of-anchor S family protein, partial [Candidatus Heimdallarchaeota archaeon]